MSELLVRLRDNTLADPIQNRKCWKRGMVITIQADGWTWGIEERTNPLFIIVKAPDLTIAQASTFMGNLIDPNSTPLNPDTTNPMRSFAFDADNATVVSIVGDGTVRLHEFITLTAAQVNFVKKAVSIP